MAGPNDTPPVSPSALSGNPTPPILDFTKTKLKVVSEKTITRPDGTTISGEREVEVSCDTFKNTLLESDPFDLQRVKVDQTFDLSAGGHYIAGPAIPAGAIVKLVILQLTAAATASGSNGVKVGVGPNGSAPSGYGLTSDLTKNQQTNTSFNSTPLGSSTNLDVCLCATGGTLSTDTFASGTARLVIIYEIMPPNLPNV